MVRLLVVPDLDAQLVCSGELVVNHVTLNNNDCLYQLFSFSIMIDLLNYHKKTTAYCI